MPRLLATSAVDIRQNLDRLSTGDAPKIQYDLGTIIGSFINVSLIVGMLAVLIYLLIGGIQWITSGGDTGKVQKARDKIIQSVVGMAVLAAAWAIFLVLQYFFGINIGVAGGGAGGPGNNGNPGSSGGSGTEICQVGQRTTFTGYCNGGVAQVQCFGPGQGATSQANYNHWEPCGCISGTEETGRYDYGSC